MTATGCPRDCGSFRAIRNARRDNTWQGTHDRLSFGNFVNIGSGGKLVRASVAQFESVAWDV